MISKVAIKHTKWQGKIVNVAEKSLPLMCDILDLTTSEGASVLDLCAGTGLFTINLKY